MFAAGGGPDSSEDQSFPAKGGFVPWYKQAGAWVAISGLTFAFAITLVLMMGPAGDRAEQAGGGLQPGATGAAGATTDVASPAAGGGASQGDYTPVATAECPQDAATPTAQAGQPAGATDLGGIRLGCDGVPGGPVAEQTKISVEVMSDYICPYCLKFEQQLGSQLEQAMRAGQIKLTVYPMGYLDAYSTSAYSSRAARAVVATAALDPAHYWAFDKLMWENQPAEGGAGLDDSQIADLARQAGVTEDAISQFTTGTYSDWVANTTQVVTASEGFQGTPWVLIGDGVNLYAWDWSGGDLQTAIAKVAAGEQP
ncbi:MAG: DsbA family protein [Bifidobacteriaceae bacterium]|jgi:protein-disulfide isomerase|nr:DsbA family protein [Bifidobacteriaceae bacterium]